MLVWRRARRMFDVGWSMDGRWVAKKYVFQSSEHTIFNNVSASSVASASSSLEP